MPLTSGSSSAGSWCIQSALDEDFERISSLPERVSRDDDGRTLSDRVFGLLIAVFWTAVAIAPVRHGGSARVWAGVLATTFLVFSVIRPTLLGPLNLQWQRLVRLLQKLTNPIVIAILFFSAVTPFGLIMRLLNRDVLAIKVGS